jgi:hypothetical protein
MKNKIMELLLNQHKYICTRNECPKLTDCQQCKAEDLTEEILKIIKEGKK